MRTVLLPLVALALIAPGVAAPKDGRRLVWSDEFGGRELDQTKWKFHATMHSTDCVYTNDARTARVENGCLHLLVVPSGDPKKPQMLPRGVSTRDRMAFRYGYLEMRAKIPFRHGAWPSFWMTAQPKMQKAAWMSEVDIFEVFSSSNAVVANLHKWAPDRRHFRLPGGEGSIKRAYVFTDCARLNDEFHVYGFEWTPKEMSFFVDGEKYTTFPIDEAHDYCPKEKLGMAGHHDFHNIHINNEIFTPGHGWCPKEKRITAGDRLPIDYWVDWIRLYQGNGEEIRFPEREKAGCCELVEVFGDHLLVHRQSVEFGRPIGPAWFVPVPARKDGPFDFAKRTAWRKAHGVAPQFAKGARVEAEFCPDGHALESAAHKGEACIHVAFPRAQTVRGCRVFDYLVEATAEGMDAPVVRKLLAAGFAYPEEDADIPGEALFSAAELPKGKPIRLSVTPRDCFGLAGYPLVATSISSACVFTGRFHFQRYKLSQSQERKIMV